MYENEIIPEEPIRWIKKSVFNEILSVRKIISNGSMLVDYLLLNKEKAYAVDDLAKKFNLAPSSVVQILSHQKRYGRIFERKTYNGDIFVCFIEQIDLAKEISNLKEAEEKQINQINLNNLENKLKDELINKVV